MFTRRNNNILIDGWLLAVVGGVVHEMIDVVIKSEILPGKLLVTWSCVDGNQVNSSWLCNLAVISALSVYLKVVNIYTLMYVIDYVNNSSTTSQNVDNIRIQNLAKQCLIVFCSINFLNHSSPSLLLFKSSNRVNYLKNF